jgi:hypothetical protein
VDALLWYLVVLTLKAGLCLLVLFGPPILVCVTAFSFHAVNSKYTKRQMVFCNLFVGVSIAVVAVVSQLGTLRTLAIAAYIVVCVLLGVFSLLACLSWFLGLSMALVRAIHQFWLRRAKPNVILGQDINASRVRL